MRQSNNRKSRDVTAFLYERPVSYTHLDVYKRQVEGSPFQGTAGIVEDGVEFGMADINILGVQGITLPVPGHFVVVTPDGHTIIAHGQNFMIGADDAGPHLGVVVLAPLSGEKGDAHKIFVPGNIILSLHTGHLS